MVGANPASVCGSSVLHDVTATRAHPANTGPIAKALIRMSDLSRCESIAVQSDRWALLPDRWATRKKSRCTLGQVSGSLCATDHSVERLSLLRARSRSASQIGGPTQEMRQ